MRRAKATKAEPALAVCRAKKMPDGKKFFSPLARSARAARAPGRARRACVPRGWREYAEITENKGQERERTNTLVSLHMLGIRIRTSRLTIIQVRENPRISSDPKEIRRFLVNFVFQKPEDLVINCATDRSFYAGWTQASMFWSEVIPMAVKKSAPKKNSSKPAKKASPKKASPKKAVKKASAKKSAPKKTPTPMSS
jgi:hypothetical protein